MRAILAFILAASLSGCVRISYTDTIGRKFEYSAPAFGVKGLKKASLDLASGLSIEGYSSEQASMVEFLRSIYEAGRTAGAKP